MGQLRLQVVPNHQVSDFTVVTLLTAGGNCLDQCSSVLSSIPDPAYCESVPNASSIGSHFRHIIERFNCLLAGIGTGTVDYDQRDREKALELERSFAAQTLSLIKHRLSGLKIVEKEALRIIETVDLDCSAVGVQSTVERELMGLISHTTHHLAIIAMLMKARGLYVDAGIGKAPSTILFEKALARQ